MMILTSSLPARDTSQRIKVNHVFECDGCHKYWLGRELVKIDGTRQCKHCFKAVQDITFTETAQMWLVYVGISPIE